MNETIPSDDDQAALVGLLAHRIIRDVVSRPGWQSLARAALSREVAAAMQGPLRKISPRRHPAQRQAVTAAVMTYLTRLRPPTQWMVSEVEASVGRGRIDLAWMSGTRVLIDEIKTGRVSSQSTATREQVERYLAAGLARWGTDLVGVRILTTSRPTQSVFVSPTGGRVALATTPFVAPDAALGVIEPLSASPRIRTAIGPRPSRTLPRRARPPPG
jgi:hypothetical protein